MMKSISHITILASFALSCAALSGCSKGDETSAPGASESVASHAEADPSGGDHGHAETPLGTAQIGEITIVCAQGHGEVGPGKEMHLVVKLPYSDNGATIVRAWVGSDDRMGSRVAKGVYASSHDDYDVHAEAPDPLPEGSTWWIEIEKPDGSKQVGSCRIL